MSSLMGVGWLVSTHTHTHPSLNEARWIKYLPDSAIAHPDGGMDEANEANEANEACAEPARSSRSRRLCRGSRRLSVPAASEGRLWRACLSYSTAHISPTRNRDVVGSTGTGWLSQASRYGQDSVVFPAEREGFFLPTLCDGLRPGLNISLSIPKQSST